LAQTSFLRPAVLLSYSILKIYWDLPLDYRVSSLQLNPVEDSENTVAWNFLHTSLAQGINIASSP
jgi:hypothetical protein